MTRDGSARIVVENSTEIVNDAMRLHHTSPTATAALGRTLTAASMMGSLMGGKEDSLTVAINGDGPVGSIVAVADYMGNVKGYVGDPTAEADAKSNGKLNVSGIVGDGRLTVSRFLDGKPYNGVVRLKSGEIAEDIAAYYAESEQLPTVCSLGVLVGEEDGRLICRAAGGVIVQLLPFADEKIIGILEKNAASLANISTLINNGATGKEIADIALAGIEYDVFDEFEVAYRCDCSRERTAKMLLGMGKNDVMKLFEEKNGEDIEAACYFCDKKYIFTKEDVEALFSSVK